MNEEQWGNRMEQTATLLERVIIDITDYANHYGKYTDFVDDTIRFKWDAEPLAKKLKKMAEYAKENKLDVGTYSL